MVLCPFFSGGDSSCDLVWDSGLGGDEYVMAGKILLVLKGYNQDVSWLMVGSSGQEKLMRIEKLKVWTGLYIMIVEVGKAYRQASGKVG